MSTAIIGFADDITRLSKLMLESSDPLEIENARTKAYMLMDNMLHMNMELAFEQRQMLQGHNQMLELQSEDLKNQRELLERQKRVFTEQQRLAWRGNLFWNLFGAVIGTILGFLLGHFIH